MVFYLVGGRWGYATMVIGASATYGETMKQELTEQGANWIECAERPFSVQQFVLQVATQE